MVNNKTTHNSTYPKVAVQWLNQTLCNYQSFCWVASEVLRNRHLQVAAKRYEQLHLQENTMEFILGDVLFAIVGWFYMLMKHRNFAQMRIVIKEKYENQYSAVGREIIFITFLIIFAISIITLMIVTIGVAIFKK